MTNNKVGLSIALCLLMASCANEEETKTEAPKPGATVVNMTEKAIKDSLNNFDISIEVKADSAGTPGTYQVYATYGPNNATGSFTMPKGIQEIVPELRHADSAQAYILGFHIPNDTTFYDYFGISCNQLTIRMWYLKSYSFQ